MQLDQQKTDSTGTYWVTYSKLYPCGVALAISTLNAPVLAPTTYQMWRQFTTTVTEDTGRMFRASFYDGTNTYTYGVDRDRWLPVRLTILGLVSYTATYVWDPNPDLPVLRKIALKYDTTMSWGGIVFTTTTINGSDGVRPSLRPYHANPGATARASLVLSTADAGTPGGVLFNLLGQQTPRVGSSHAIPGARILHLPTPVNHEAPAR